MRGSVYKLKGGVKAIQSGNFDSAATFVESPSAPYKSWFKVGDNVTHFIEGFDPWQPWKVLPKTYVLNGAVYTVKTDIFLADPSDSFLPGRNTMVSMPAERSIDIDTALDLTIAEAVLQSQAAG